MKDNRYKVYIECSTGPVDSTTYTGLSSDAMYDFCDALRHLGQKNTGAFDLLTPRKLYSLLSSRFRGLETDAIKAESSHVHALCRHRMLRQLDVSPMFKQSHRDALEDVLALIRCVLKDPEFGEDTCWQWMRRATSLPMG